MPFDATPQIETRPSVADVLRRAKALIDTPEKWAKGNHIVGSALCVEGAILMAGRGDIGDGLDGLLADAAEDAFCIFCEATELKSPCRWNDAPERTHADVMAAFDRAIAYAGSA